MKAVVLYHPAADVLEKAPLHFPAHKAMLDEAHAKGDLLAVGPFADPREGSMGIFRSRAAAEAFIAVDPFVLDGVVARYEIKDWNEILLPA